MNIPVYVQRPCEPQSATYVGDASDSLSAEQVASDVGIPVDEYGESCLLDGKIIKSRKRGRHWSLVAHVGFRTN